MLRGKYFEILAGEFANQRTPAGRLSEACIALSLKVMAYSFLRLMDRERRVFRLRFRIYMASSVVLPVVAFRFWAWLDIGQHALHIQMDVFE